MNINKIASNEINSLDLNFSHKKKKKIIIIKKKKIKKIKKKIINTIHNESDNESIPSEDENNLIKNNFYNYDTEIKNFKCEYSPNNRAKCKKCREKLIKGNIRIGKVDEFEGHDSISYYHLECLIDKLKRARKIKWDSTRPILERNLITNGFTEKLYLLDSKVKNKKKKKK